MSASIAGVAHEGTCTQLIYYHTKESASTARKKVVMSSRLCKKPKGGVFPFVLLVHSVEDGIDDPVDAGDVDEADHGARAPPDLHKAALDDIGGAQLFPERLGEAEEAQQLGQVTLQPLRHSRIDPSPAG